ncbi:MAG: hypothetical protein NC200_00705 [Candidatus Gastranaerophilales bacterium]|nr:hypothetical protein [Candidatus Gastranaerophilales bacterium]
MNFDESNEKNKYTAHDSIFEDSEVAGLFAAHNIDIDAFDYEKIKDDGLFSKLINTISDKLTSTPKIDKNRKKMQKLADDAFKDNEDMLKLFNDFGCVMVLHEDYIELNAERFNLSGKISLNDENKFEFDEDAQKILYIISQLIEKVNNADANFDKSEQEGFYPVGDLEETIIMLDGQETKVLCGTLMNASGMTKKMYFHNGVEVVPD